MGERMGESRCLRAAMRGLRCGGCVGENISEGKRQGDGVRRAWVSVGERMSERQPTEGAEESVVLHHNVPLIGGTRQCSVPGEGRKPGEKLWPKAGKEKPWMLFYADGLHCAARQRCKTRPH